MIILMDLFNQRYNLFFNFLEDSLLGLFYKLGLTCLYDIKGSIFLIYLIDVMISNWGTVFVTLSS